jgi:ABC-type transport system substrate-binding protein
MAGPYYYASYTPKRRLVLRRNPNYGGSRPARIRELEIEFEPPAARAVASVEAGHADYVNVVPQDRIATLAQRYGAGGPAARTGRQRYFSASEPFLHFFAFNTRRPLFARLRMRQAVNYALDRQELRQGVFNGDRGAPGRPTDQFMPPGLPGFRDAAIYPLGGPDLKRARRLAGPRRRRAILLTCTAPACVEQGRVLRRNLAAIGIDLTVKTYPISQTWGRLQDPDVQWDLGYMNWTMDVADPTFMTDLVAPAVPAEGIVGGFHTRRLDRQIQATVRILDPDARLRAFEQLDADLARAGAAAPFATTSSTDFFSDRIGCQVQQPIYGIALGALCVRD